MRLIKSLLNIIALLTFGSAVVFASPVTYSFQGVDNTGALVAGAVVTVGATTLTSNTTTTLVATSVPASAGEYVIGTRAIPSGAISLTLIDYGQGQYTITYDPALYGELYIPLTITASGHTFTPSIVNVILTADSSQVGKLLFDGSSNIKSDPQTGTITSVTGSVGSVTAAVTLPATAPTGFLSLDTTAQLITTQTSPANQALYTQNGLTAQGINAAFITASTVNNTDAPLIYSAVQTLPSAAAIAVATISAMKADPVLKIALTDHNLNKITYTPLTATTGTIYYLGDDNVALGQATVTTNTSGVILSRE